jgi:hypothetical protein
MTAAASRKYIQIRSTRDGDIYGHEQRGGREVYMGRTWKTAAGWKHDQASTTYPRQADAIRALRQIVRPVAQ